MTKKKQKLPITESQIFTVLRRTCPMELIPEVLLIIKILSSAISDAIGLPGMQINQQDINIARGFVFGQGARNYCEIVGIEYDAYIRIYEIAKKTWNNGRGKNA